MVHSSQAERSGALGRLRGLLCGARVATAVSLACLLVGCSFEPAEGDAAVNESETVVSNGAGLDPMGLLEQARAAAIATRTVHHRFLFGSRDPEEAVVTGETWMQARTTAADSLIRVNGVERFSEPEPFLYSTNGETVWAVADATGTAVRAVAGPHSRGLAASAVYGFLTEFVEVAPYWKELGSSTSRTLLGQEDVGGVLCNVLQIEYPEHDGVKPRHVWYLGAQDFLPRGLAWWDSTTGPDGLSLWILDLDTRALDATVFDVQLDPGVTVTDLPTPPGTFTSWSAASRSGDQVQAG